jgi:hypothetical protein
MRNEQALTPTVETKADPQSVRRIRPARVKRLVPGLRIKFCAKGTGMSSQGELLNSSSSPFASFRSAVSKPSVNQL